MLAIKKYFTSRKRRNSAEYVSDGVSCSTCSPPPPLPPLPAYHHHHYQPTTTSSSSSSLTLLKDLPGASGSRQDDEQTSRRHHRYRRSVSLGQILQQPDCPCSEGLTGACSPYRHSLSSSSSCSNSGASPPDAPHTHGRELSDFEKENLLFLRELDNSYHHPHNHHNHPHNHHNHNYHHPLLLSHSHSNTSLGSTFSEDSLTGDSTPRGGSPYPGRREYPRTAYSPSKTSPSKILHSVSKEEEDEEEEVDDLPKDEVERSGRAKNHVSSKRRSYLPIYMGRGSTSDSSAPSSVCSLPGSSSAWWSRPRPQSPRKLPANHTPRFPSPYQPRMLLTNGSLPSPASQPSRTAAANHRAPGLQKGPWLASAPRGRGNPLPVKTTKDTDTKAAIITSSSSSPAAIEQVSTVTSSSSTSTTVSSSSTSDHQQQQHQHQQQPGGGESAGSPRDGLREVSPTDTKKPTPMAFTIELGGGTSASDLASTKKLDITASISKWAPKHRRNLSLTKVEEHKKVEERGGKPPVGRPRSGTIGATGLQQGRRGGGYHSEGYFSSDQDDEGPRRTELKSPRSPRTPELRSPQTPQRLVRSTSQDSAKGASLRKQTGKTEGRACCKVDKKPTVAEVTGKAKSEKGSKQNTVKMTPEGRKQSNSANSLSSCQTYDVKQDAESEGGKEEKDDVSEAGTYTIEKDSSSPEVEQARSDIDRVFGVSGTESEVDVTVVTPRGNATTEELWTPTPEKDKFKSPGSISRSSPNWIRQWAAQVAEHTKSSDVSVKTSLGSPRGSKPPLASLSSSQESSESRPRRKLPTPPTHHPPYTMVSPKASDLSDHESPTKGQARVDMNKGISPGLRGTSFESHDSGGDSDLDTSTSYPINDDDDRLVKTIGSQLKTRLKLAGIDGTSKTPPAATIPRKPDPLPVETRIKLTSHFKRERSIVSDSGLRRARLASEEATQQHKSPSPVDKKKIARPSSAGNLSGSRKIPLSQSKSHQGGHALSRSGSHSQATTPKSGSNDFSRGDGGRFSLRLPNSVSSTTVSKSPSRTSVKKELSGSRRGAPRSNSTLSAKEVDFQNWKRRKNYDPMKAAAEGRKKPGDKKSDKLSQGNTHSTNERSPSPPVSLLRSASFHGTEGMGVAGRWPRRPNHLYTSEDDGPCSLEEEQPHPVPHCSPLRRSPTSPHQLSSPHTTSPARQATLSSARARRASYALSDEGEGHVGSPRKTSLDESGSEGKRSPLGSTRGIVSGRSKAKMEALDNLVISTIHSLSVKVRTTSETLLQKLKSQYDEEGDRAALLEEVLAHLSESDQTLTSGQSRSTSRELAGILRNLKKIEHALEVIDRVMVCVDDDDLDEDDLDGTTGHDWGGSDY